MTFFNFDSLKKKLGDLAENKTPEEIQELADARMREVVKGMELFIDIERESVHALKKSVESGDYELQSPVNLFKARTRTELLEGLKGLTYIQMQMNRGLLLTIIKTAILQKDAEGGDKK